MGCGDPPLGVWVVYNPWGPTDRCYSHTFPFPLARERALFFHPMAHNRASFPGRPAHPITSATQYALATGQMNQLLARLQSGFLIPRPNRAPLTGTASSVGSEFEYKEYTSKKIEDAITMTSTDVIACAAINRISAGMGTLKMQFKQPSAVLRSIFPDAVLDRIAREQSRIHTEAYRQLVTLGFIAFRVMRDLVVDANGEDVAPGWPASTPDGAFKTFCIPTTQIVDPHEVVFAKQIHVATRATKMVARQRAGTGMSMGMDMGMGATDAIDERVFFYVKDMPGDEMISPAFQALRAQRAGQANDRARQHAQAMMSNPPVAIRYHPSAAAVRDGVYAATVSEGVTEIQDEKVNQAMVGAVTTCHATAATMQAYVFEPETTLRTTDVVDSEPGGIGAPLSVSGPTDTTKRLVILPQNTEVVPIPIAAIPTDALADKEMQMKLVATAFKYPYQMLMSADANPHSSALLENQVDRATDEARKDICAFDELVMSLTVCADLREFGRGTRKIGTKLLSSATKGAAKNRRRRYGVVMEPTVEYVTSESRAADARAAARAMRRRAAAFSLSDDESSSSSSSGSDGDSEEERVPARPRKHPTAAQLWAAAEDVSDEDVGEKEQEKLARAQQMLALALGTRSTEIVARFEGGMGMRQENTLAAYQQFFIPWETARKSLAEHLHLPEAALSVGDPREVQRQFELDVMKDGMRVKEGLVQRALAAAVVDPVSKGGAKASANADDDDDEPDGKPEDRTKDVDGTKPGDKSKDGTKAKSKDEAKPKGASSDGSDGKLKDKSGAVSKGKAKAKAKAKKTKRDAADADSDLDSGDDGKASKKKASSKHDHDKSKKKRKVVAAAAAAAASAAADDEGDYITRDVSVTRGDEQESFREQEERHEAVPGLKLASGPPLAASPNVSAVC